MAVGGGGPVAGGFVAAATGVGAFGGGLVVGLRACFGAFAATGVIFVGFVRLSLFGFLL